MFLKFWGDDLDSLHLQIISPKFQLIIAICEGGAMPFLLNSIESILCPNLQNSLKFTFYFAQVFEQGQTSDVVLIGESFDGQKGWLLAKEKKK